MKNSLSGILAALLMWLSPLLLRAQVEDSDDIVVQVVIPPCLDIRIVEGKNVDFVVSSLDNYVNGISDPLAYSTVFEVSSSQNFQVMLLTALFYSPTTDDELASGNFGFRIEDAGNYAVGDRHLLLGGSSSPSPLAAMDTDHTIITAANLGNSGNYADNRFRLSFELGTASVRALSGLPTLLEQNIAPVTYIGAVLLLATTTP